MFCSDRCRVKYNREVHLACFYCGELGAQRDHITPHSLMNVGKVRKFKGKETVNACPECNKLASNKNGIFLEDKILMLIERYKTRYSLLDIIPEWSDEELKELGTSLKSAVKNKILKRQVAIEKVLHLKARYYEVIRHYSEDQESNYEDG